MNKYAALALAGAILVAAPAYAKTDAETREDIKADKGAIHKDNVTIDKAQDELSKDRAAKAEAKANGDYGTQAQKSLEIGADHTAIGEKKLEKKADEKILEHHETEKNEANR